MRRILVLGVVVVVAALAAGVWMLIPGRAERPPRDVPFDTRTLLGGADTSGFARVLAPHPFEFPRDHADHPDFRHEWWYVTGNLRDPQGRHFGYQFALFRFALQPEKVRGASAWRTRQVYMGHFAVTDVATRRFHAFQRFSRAALGMAGASVEPLKIWLDDWSLSAAGDGPVWRIAAAQEGTAADLTLTPLKPVVLQGDRGLSRKGAEPGNASYYYSLTRLATRGSLSIGGKTYAVEGDSWLDREWGTSALGANVVGWDWFALQLRDGRDLMLYHLRRADGTPAPYSAGVMVDAAGRAAALTLHPDSLVVTATWRSPRTGIEYPAAWHLHLPGQGLELDVRPRVAAQEWDKAVRYWEGAVGVEGHSTDGAVSGSGYAELTGYTSTERKNEP